MTWRAWLAVGALTVSSVVIARALILAFREDRRRRNRQLYMSLAWLRKREREEEEGRG